MGNQWDAVEKKVLAENTAQAILKHLKRLEEKRAILGARWIWELIQNARDAATSAGVNVSVCLSGDELTFEHDGRPFRHEELAHLIYHGTTKLDQKDNVGHFGSGFMSTHLLSRRVQVTGTVEGGGRFEFWLDRSSTDQIALAAAMQQSMNDCKQSCGLGSIEGHSSCTAFAYPLDARGSVLASEGIEDLKEWGPMVLALAGEIASISVSTGSGTWRLWRGEPRRLAADLDLATINVEESSAAPRPHYIAVAQVDGGVQAALPLNIVNGGFSVGLDERTPRVFVLFPILGTDRLALPAVIQSRQFEPVEDRDGIWLNSESPTAVTNREIVEAALPAIKLLIETAAAQEWSETHRLLAFDTSNRPEWVDESWLRQLLGRVLNEVAHVALVPTIGGGWVTPRTAWLPMAEAPVQQSCLWELARGLSASQTRLPPQESAFGWSRNLKNWAQLFNRPASDDPAAFTLSRLARMVSESETTANLASRLQNPKEVFAWLSRMLNLVQETGQTRLHDDLALLPSQGGKLRRRGELAVDGGVPDDLKKVGEALEIDIRGSLLDTGVDVPGLEQLLSSKEEEQVVDELVAALKRACQGGRMPTALVSASVDLFWWLAGREEYAAKLDRFPIATADGSDDSCTIVELPRRDQVDARLLAPVPTWPEEARRFAALFPRRKVLNAAFAADSAGANWTQLSERGLVHAVPLYVASLRLEDGLVVDPLVEDTEHRSEHAIRLTNIACLGDKDIGLIDTARKSRSRAIQLIEFLLEFVLRNDHQAFQHAAVQCECMLEHKVFCAAWLAPLRRRKWIPSETEGYSADHATAQSLSGLLAGRPDLVRQFETEAGRSLLLALGISPADLALRVVAPDEESRVSLIRSVGDLAQAAGGVEGVRQLVNDIRDDPKFLDAITERKTNRERVRRNQGIGRLVEQLLREQLVARGLSVERTGTGSDFEVECDFVEDGQEVVLKLGIEGGSTLLEVKSARGDCVKMTPRQAETACGVGDGFALCVVPLAEEAVSAKDILERSRFVFGVGTQLSEAWSAFQVIERATDAAELTGGGVELEIIEGQVRFKVASEVWKDALDFESAITAIVKRSAPLEQVQPD